MILQRRLSWRLGRFDTSPHSMESIRYYDIMSFKNLSLDSSICKLPRTSVRWIKLNTVILWKNYLPLTGQNACKPVASDDRMKDRRWTTVCERGSLADDAVRSATTMRIILTRTSNTRAMSRHRYHDEKEFYCQRNPGRRCDYEGPCDDFRRHVRNVYKSIPQYLICCEEHRDRRHWRRRSLVRPLSFNV